METNFLNSCIVEVLSPEVFTSLKPGAHCVIHSTPRTNHIIATEAENMGFEIRDVIVYLGDETEFWILCRRPLEENTVAKNVLKHGVGGLNIGGTRIGSESRKNDQKDTKAWKRDSWGEHPQKSNGQYKQVVGRWPANLILSEDSAAQLDEQSGLLKSGSIKPHHVRTTSKTKNAYGERAAVSGFIEADSGGASRFFFTSKSKEDLLDYLTKLITPKQGRTHVFK